jgi:hypothetical protein
MSRSSAQSRGFSEASVVRRPANGMQKRGNRVNHLDKAKLVYVSYATNELFCSKYASS